MVGKLPPKLLESLVYTKLGVRDPSVLMGPAVGEDAAVIDLGGGLALVVHNDAITGASRLLGWLAVHIVANDVAVRGVRPRWFLMSLFLPEGASEQLLNEIMSQVDSAARDLKMMVIGGHTETTPGLDRPIVGTTAIGVAPVNRVVTTCGARPGDYLLMTKAAALEGTSILCTDFADALEGKGVSRSLIERGAQLVKRVSVVPEALALAERGMATAMHDPTEGGVLGGAAELAYASGTTVELWTSRVPVLEETRVAAEVLGVNALRLISSGALLAAVPPSRVEEALSTLQSIGVEAAVVGRVEGREDCLVKVIGEGAVEKVSDVHVTDELFSLWVRLRASAQAHAG